MQMAPFPPFGVIIPFACPQRNCAIYFHPGFPGALLKTQAHVFLFCVKVEPASSKNARSARLGPPARCQLLPLFLGEGSPTQIDYRRTGYSNLPTGGHSRCQVSGPHEQRFEVDRLHRSHRGITSAAYEAPRFFGGRCGCFCTKDTYDGWVHITTVVYRRIVIFQTGFLFMGVAPVSLPRSQVILSSSAGFDLLVFPFWSICSRDPKN